MVPHRNSAQAKIRLVVASTHSHSTHSLTHILASDSDFEIVETVTPETLSSGLSPAPDPDVLLLEVDIHRRDMLRLLENIKKESAGIRTVVILRHADDASLRMFLRAGAQGIVLKKADGSVLFDAIRAVHQGHRYLDTGLSDAIMNVIESGSISGRNVELTNREQQVLSLIGSGRTYKEIASTLNVSVKTVETYRTRIGEKLQLHTRKALMAFAIANGFTK